MSFNPHLTEFVPQEQFLQLSHPLSLETGRTLYNPLIAFQTWGRLNDDRSNVVWVCHALTGNHRVHEWWDGLFGPGKYFDPEDYFIVAVNVPGSCYGTTGPLSPVENGLPGYTDFPLVTVRDMVSALDEVRSFLAIDKIRVLIGASLGGQQVLEWAIRQPELFETIIPIATNAWHSPFGIAFNEAQRLAIQADPTFAANTPEGGTNGLIAARSIAMLSYRTYEGYGLTQAEPSTEKADQFRAASYQQYQGEKLSKRFNAYSYWYLSKAMDSHNIARNRVPAAELLQQLDIPALVVGIDSDLLFPISEQRFLAEHLPQAELAVLSSAFGHDGFLVEYEQLTTAIRQFFNNPKTKQPAKAETSTKNEAL